MHLFSSNSRLIGLDSNTPICYLHSFPPICQATLMNMFVFSKKYWHSVREIAKSATCSCSKNIGSLSNKCLELEKKKDIKHGLSEAITFLRIICGQCYINVLSVTIIHLPRLGALLLLLEKNHTETAHM